MPNPENVIKNKIKTTTEARKRGKSGGIKSGIAKRKKKLLSDIFADIIAKRTGQKEGLNISTVVEQVLVEGGSPAVGMLKVMLEATEGRKVKLTDETDRTEIIKELARLRKEHLEPDNN